MYDDEDDVDDDGRRDQVRMKPTLSRSNCNVGLHTLLNLNVY